MTHFDQRGQHVQQQYNIESMSIGEISQKRKKSKRQESTEITLLFLVANPQDTEKLRLDQEIREIDEALRKSALQDRFVIKQRWAVRVADLQDSLLRYKPHIVHFSGHGSTSNEILVEDADGFSFPLPTNTLGQLFSLLKDNIRCVVLNACYSEQQAQAIAQHIDCVIGMPQSINDQVAIAFASAFYQALGDGRNMQTAFDLGCTRINLAYRNIQTMPKLLATLCDPADVVL